MSLIMTFFHADKCLTSQQFSIGLSFHDPDHPSNPLRFSFRERADCRSREAFAELGIIFVELDSLVKLKSQQGLHGNRNVVDERLLLLTEEL